ncbi:MAG: hypothetical protein ACK4YV_01510 [Emticicia sp.]
MINQISFNVRPYFVMNRSTHNVKNWRLSEAEVPILGVSTTPNDQNDSFLFFA